jgi:hypothetical protein
MDDVDYDMGSSNGGSIVSTSRVFSGSPDVDTHSCQLLGPIALVSAVATF